MAALLGIDIGTSSTKAMILDTVTGETYVEASDYDVEIPQTKYAEQSPETWWQSVVVILKRLKDGQPEIFDKISSIGFSGQMHGIVMLDQNGHPLRPAILWLDQRSSAQLADINKRVSKDTFKEVLHNRVSTGFAFPSLLWVQENEPEIYSEIYKVMQPKDYVRYKITGKIGTDVTDASASLMLDVGKRQWAGGILNEFGISRSIMPDCYESMDVAGYVTEACASETGLKVGIPVVYGAGDQQAQSIGNGAVSEGVTIANIGTGGQISTFLSEDKYDLELRTHTFCHGINGAYTIFGASLCSGLSLKWLKDNILNMDKFDDMSENAAEISAGSDGLIYLPYLTGERTPHMNPKAKGMFFGLELNHNRGHMIRSVMEGVTFSLKDSLGIFEEIGVDSDWIIASGGGASSPVWLQIQADIFEKEVRVCTVKEQACLGACIMAGVGAGMFTDVKEACKAFVKFDERVYTPNTANIDRYRELYETYKKLYLQTVELM